MKRIFLSALSLILGLSLISAPSSVASAIRTCNSNEFSVTAKHNSVFYFDSGTTITSGYAQYEIKNESSTAGTYWAKIESFSGGALGLAEFESATRSLGPLNPSETSTQYWYLTATAISASAQDHEVVFYDSDPGSGSPTPICKIVKGFTKTESTISANSNTISSVTYSAIPSPSASGSATFVATVEGNPGTIGDGPTSSYDINLGPATHAKFPASNYRLSATSFKCGSAAAITGSLYIPATNATKCSSNYVAEFTFKYLSSTLPTGASDKLSPIMQIASGSQMKHSDPPAPGIVGGIQAAASGTPEVTTIDATNITTTAARLQGRIVYGTFTSTYFCFSETTTVSSFPANCADSSTAVTGSPYYRFDKTGLSVGTTYYFEFLGVSGGTTYFGGVKSFTTTSSTPTPTPTPTPACIVPSISRVTPNYGSSRGGQVITIYGSDLTSPITYNGQVLEMISQTPNKALFKAPKMEKGKNYFGMSYCGGSQLFTFDSDPEPVIKKVETPKICLANGIGRLSGDFLLGAKVFVDSTSVEVTENTDNEITFKYLFSNSGAKKVKVETEFGSTTVDVTYIELPTIKKIRVPYLYKNGDFNLPYSALNGESYKVIGKLPPGLSLNKKTGAIRGTPAQDGIFTFTLVAVGNCGESKQEITLDIDREIPKAMSHRIFFGKNKKNINPNIEKKLDEFIEKAKKNGPRNLDPIIIFTGGSAPTKDDPTGCDTANARYQAILDAIEDAGLDPEIADSVFEGKNTEVEIIIYWILPGEPS